MPIRIFARKYNVVARVSHPKEHFTPSEGYKNAPRSSSEGPASQLADSLTKELLSKDGAFSYRNQSGFRPGHTLPVSDRYRHVKNWSPDERALVGHVALGNLKAGRGEPHDAMVTLEAKWEAQLRIHSLGEKASHRAATFAAVAGSVYVLPLAPLYMRAIYLFHDEYNRDRSRPEYAVAFNEMMEVMRMPSLEKPLKDRVAALVVDYMREGDGQRLLVPKDHNDLVRAIVPNGPKEPEGGHATLRVPRRGTDAQELKVINAVIQFAENGGRSVVSPPKAPMPAKSPGRAKESIDGLRRRTVDPMHQAVLDRSDIERMGGDRLLELYEYEQISGPKVSLDELIANGRQRRLNLTSTCVVSGRNIFEVERPVAVFATAEEALDADRASEDASATGSVYGPLPSLANFPALFQSVEKASEHPVTKAPLAPYDLSQITRPLNIN